MNDFQLLGASGGGMTESVVATTPYLTVHLVSVILTGINRVVVIGGMESVVTQKNSVLVGNVKTTHVYTESGKKQEVHRSGDTTESVVITTSYLTAHLLSVILTEISRVVIVIGMETVVTQQNIVLVGTVQTTHAYPKTGKNLMVHRSGHTTESVVMTTPYLTVHLVSVILTGSFHAAMREREDAVVHVKIVHVKTVLTTER